MIAFFKKLLAFFSRRKAETHADLFVKIETPERPQQSVTIKNSALNRVISAINLLEKGESKQKVSESLHYSSADTMMHAIRRYKRYNAIGQCGRCGKAIRRDQEYCAYCAGFYTPFRKEVRS